MLSFLFNEQGLLYVLRSAKIILDIKMQKFCQHFHDSYVKSSAFPKHTTWNASKKELCSTEAKYASYFKIQCQGNLLL